MGHTFMPSIALAVRLNELFVWGVSGVQARASARSSKASILIRQLCASSSRPAAEIIYELMLLCCEAVWCARGRCGSSSRPSRMFLFRGVYFTCNRYPLWSCGSGVLLSSAKGLHPSRMTTAYHHGCTACSVHVVGDGTMTS